MFRFYELHHTIIYHTVTYYPIVYTILYPILHIGILMLMFFGLAAGLEST